LAAIGDYFGHLPGFKYGPLLVKPNAFESSGIIWMRVSFKPSEDPLELLVLNSCRSYFMFQKRFAQLIFCVIRTTMPAESVCADPDRVLREAVQEEARIPFYPLPPVGVLSFAIRTFGTLR
jgi:hypothetical protein